MNNYEFKKRTIKEQTININAKNVEEAIDLFFAINEQTDVLNKKLGNNDDEKCELGIKEWCEIDITSDDPLMEEHLKENYADCFNDEDEELYECEDEECQDIDCDRADKEK